jgi:hypothetical protein
MSTRGLHRLARVLGKRATLGAMSTIACAAALAACGESEDPKPTISQGASDALIAALDRVQDLVDAGDCTGAEATAQNVRDAIDGLPADVPDDVEQTLVKASDNLVSQTRTQCEPADEPPEDEDPSGATGEEGVAP